MDFATTTEAVMRKPISTATIYASEEEWAVFKNLTADEFRQEAGQLADLAKKAVEKDNFRLLSLPPGARRSRQIKTVLAGPYLMRIAADYKEKTGREISPTDVAESLVRGLSVQ